MPSSRQYLEALRSIIAQARAVVSSPHTSVERASELLDAATALTEQLITESPAAALGKLGGSATAARLERELATYKRKLPELAAEEGKFVLIQGDNVVDTYGTYEDALKEGYAKFKLTPFLVRQIHSIEQVQFVSRLLQCHTSHVR